MPKKLIEVALPLEAINKAAAREKSIRHGHPSTLHLWWARRPLAAARAVLFAQLVDDPSTWPELAGDEAAQKRERERLFTMIEDMVPWEATHEEATIREVRREIARSHARFRRGTPKADAVLADGVAPELVNDYLATELPPVHDPFAGGGTIPLEAQRLGLRAIASDLNPVAVLINKALIEIPPKFAGQPPVNPASKRSSKMRTWKGAEGLAEDVRYYGKWMRDEAFKRIGHLYPKVQLPKEHGGGEATVIAWLWARTVKCPNPACRIAAPLIRTRILSRKRGNLVTLQPAVGASTVSFSVVSGNNEVTDGTVNRTGGKCIACQTGIPFDSIREAGIKKELGSQLLAMVVESKDGRKYLPASREQEQVADMVADGWSPATEMPFNPFSVRPPLYGLKQYRDIFSQRQLTMLNTVADLVIQASDTVQADAKSSGRFSDGKGLESDGDGSLSYSQAIATYLAFSLSKALTRNCTLTIWEPGMDRLAGTLGRQALPMTWDYAETNPFAGAGGDVEGTASSLAEVLEKLPSSPAGSSIQLDASQLRHREQAAAYSTDPPYYNNIDYADLSDFFYVWLRRTLGTIWPVTLATLLTPKSEELVASKYRFDGNKELARDFFERGLKSVFGSLRNSQASELTTVYYAFKQSESEDAEDETSTSTSSTGWDTMLSGLVDEGFQVVGTWPMRTELVVGLKKDMGALASSIVLVCRKRPDTAPSATRQEFLRALKRTLPRDLKLLQQGNIAPVDFAQAAIGPGMAVFSSYARVLESDGAAMAVRTALQLINQVLDEVLSEQEGEFDADTRCAVAWFEQHQYADGEFGSADTLARAKNTSVAGLVEAGVLHAARGKVRLRTRAELDPAWDPATDARCTVWEVTQHLIRAQEKDGETGAARLLARMGTQADAARDLAYRLYSLCERKKWAQEAMGYNALVSAWPELTRLAATVAAPQGELFG